MEPNRTLSHYRLIEKIGEGGMGVVWKAEDTVLGRTVAVKVVDFGLAALFTRGESTFGGDSRALSEVETLSEGDRPEERRIAGTLPYMSPEQVRGEDLDARSDIFSLGVVLYEMTTGQRPFTGATPINIAQRIQEGRPKPVHEVVPDVPLDLDRSIHKALAPRRGERYQTMDDLAVDLKRLARDLESGSSPSYASVLGGVRRRAWRWWVAGGAILLVAAAVGTSWWLLHSSTGSAPPAARTILILPMEVRGQAEGAEFVGRAFAEAIVVNLTRWKDLKVLPVPESKEIGGAGGTLRAEMARNQGAGILLAGALTRSGGKVEASVNLIDTAENRVLWGAQKSGTDDALSPLASTVAQDLATHLGLVPRKLYGEFDEGYGGPKMSVSPELAESLDAYRAGNWKAYREATERLVLAFPDEPDAWNHRIVALALFNSLEEIPARRKEIEVRLATLARLDPESPRMEYQRAFLGYMWDGDYRGAIEGYTKVLQRPDLTPHLRCVVLGLRGGSEAAIGESQAAIADLQEAVRLDPSGWMNYYNGALTLSSLGRFEEATQFARQALTISPSNHTHRMLGLVLLYAGKVEESLEPLSKGCDDQSPVLWREWYGRALSISGRHREALSLLSPLCESSPGACLTYAIALLRAGKRGEAEGILKKATSLPEKDSVYGSAGYQAVAGNKAEALRLLRRALELGVLTSLNQYDPDLKSLRGDSEFERILDEVGKPAANK